MGAFSGEHGKKFHKYVAEMEKTSTVKWNTNVLVDRCIQVTRSYTNKNLNKITFFMVDFMPF